MSFSDIIQSILGFFKEDWVQTIVGIFYTGGGAAVITTYLKLRNKYKGVVNNTSADTSKINNNVGKIAHEQEAIKKDQEEIQKELKVLTQAITALGNIISSVFVDSKAVTRDTKISISKSIAKLEQIGLDMEVTSDVKKAIEAANIVAKEVVDEIIEEHKTSAQEEQSIAEGTEEKAYEVYNKILEEYNEQ